MLRKIFVGLIAGLICGVISYGQFADCSTGLLQAPTAEMQPDGTFMITNNWLNQNALPSSGWSYSTFQYGINITFWERIEIGYVCTIFNDYWVYSSTPDRGFYIVNQDRHFTGRLCLLRENEFGIKWMPALVIGVSDPTTGSGDFEYTSFDDLTGTGNGYFNRYYAVLTKHFSSPWGNIGAHLGYQYNQRIDYHLNGPCAGINWSPIWLQQKGLLDYLNVIVEYDSRTVNFGFIASLWHNRFEAMFDMQNFRWICFGLRYKLRLKV